MDVLVIVGIDRKEEQYAVAADCWPNLVTAEVTAAQKAVVFLVAGTALATASMAAKRVRCMIMSAADDDTCLVWMSRIGPKRTTSRPYIYFCQSSIRTLL